jgi:hypothetical protein
MDIMNNMTVSTSKFTFSLIAIAALLISGSAFVIEDIHAAPGFDAPEFTAYHINTTATHIQFDQAVNGTLAIADWGIRVLNTTTATYPAHYDDTRYAGDITYDVAISNIANSSSTGIGLTVPSQDDKDQSSLSTPANAVVGLGFINGTDIVMIHATIPTGSQYYINYTNNPSLTGNQTTAGGSGAIHTSGGDASLGHKTGGEGSGNNKMLKIGSNATAQDWILPVVSSAEILKSNPSQVRITMSENIFSINATTTQFSLTGDTGSGNANVMTSVISTNGSNAYLYVNLQDPANVGDALTITYTPGTTWITDDRNSTRYGIAQFTTADYVTGHGNRAATFTTTITNWLTTGMYGNDNCYDCQAPTVAAVAVSLDSSTPITVNDNNKVHINAAIGDTVSVIVTVDDNIGADTVPFAGLYTNFGETPDNLYYSNNFDSAKQMSTSYYEWNVRGDDVAFDNNGAITWTDATAKVNSDRTQTFTYTMTINDSLDSSQVWVDIGDNAGNYAKVALPITLEVSGAPGLTFASDDTQKVVSFFNESILLAIVSQWTANSSDDASNVEQLSSVLGIESQLPTWTTELASWVADDKIDVADMIVAVEYVINL